MPHPRTPLLLALALCLCSIFPAFINDANAQDPNMYKLDPRDTLTYLKSDAEVNSNCLNHAQLHGAVAQSTVNGDVCGRTMVLSYRRVNDKLNLYMVALTRAIDECRKKYPKLIPSNAHVNCVW